MKWSKYFFPFLVLLYLLSQIFYLYSFTEERIIFSDTGFQLFNLINDGYPAVMTDRWPLVSQRFLPFILILIKAPLTFVIYAYSINIFLIEAMILAVLLHKANYKYALSWILILMLARVETIFWCPSDLIVSVGFSLLLFSYLDSIKKHTILSIILGITILFCHPLAIFPLIFKIANDTLVSKKYKAFDISFSLSLVILWCLRNLVFGHWYINAKRNTLGDNILNYKWEFWAIDTNSQLVHEMITQYVPLSLLILLIVIYLFFNKQFKSILFSIVFSFFYIQLVNYTNATQASSFYREAS